MKSKFLILFILGLWGCKQEPVEKDPVVKEFVDQLKQGTYTGFVLPKFEVRHIPELLQYRNDLTLITSFPGNPVSSAYIREVYLGTYILWNIEAIRARAVGSETLMLESFPSRNPYLRDKTAPPSPLKSSVEAQSVASAAYYSWWHKNQSMDNDPLADTHYEWW